MDFSSYKIGTININTITNTTKLDALLCFIRSQELDIVFLQEVENDRLCLPGYNVICNVDHMRRGTAIALKDYIVFSSIEKSVDGRLITLRVQDVTLCCIYAPSGSALRSESERFFNNTIAFYLRHLPTHVVVSGDFNCVLRQCDATGTNTSPALLNTVRQLQLRDVWEQINPLVAGHTYITQNSSSRLDRVYVSAGLCEHLRSADTHVCSFSDHKAVTVRLSLPNLGRATGTGFWSLRPHLLTNEHIEELQHQWQFWTRHRRNYPSWMQWWICYAKPQIKLFFRWKSKAAIDDHHLKHQRLYEELRLAYDAFYHNPIMLTTINRIKGQLLALQRNFTQMFVRINETLVAGEPISTFQLGERKRKRTTITRLDDEQGNHISCSDGIEQHLLRYFRGLYGRDETIDHTDNTFECERAVPERDETNQACMCEITTTEIFSAIRTSASKKSPGSDGLPKEFYLRAFDVIHRELNLVLNEALSGAFPPEFVNGVIVLVKKKNAGNTARSFRPLSLLNFDYKILSRVLKARLERVMRVHGILSPAQKCSNSERNIYEATLALKDRITQLIRRGQRGRVVSFDLDHAFDRVDHAFLFRTMRSLGINSDFVDLLSRIAEAASPDC